MDLSIDDKKMVFEELQRFYDLADEILDAINAPNNKHPEFQTKIAEPVIEQVENAVERIGDLWMDMHEENRKASPKEQKAVAKELRLLFNSIIEATKKIIQQPV